MDPFWVSFWQSGMSLSFASETPSNYKPDIWVRALNAGMHIQTWGKLVCSAIAVLVYLNTLAADFAFDDGFAVVSAQRQWIEDARHAKNTSADFCLCCVAHKYLNNGLAHVALPQISNKDLTDDSVSLRSILVHDFWWVFLVSHGAEGVCTVGVWFQQSLSVHATSSPRKGENTLPACSRLS
jgi:hypothetical protein